MKSLILKASLLARIATAALSLETVTTAAYSSTINNGVQECGAG